MTLESNRLTCIIVITDNVYAIKKRSNNRRVGEVGTNSCIKVTTQDSRTFSVLGNKIQNRPGWVLENPLIQACKKDTGFSYLHDESSTPSQESSTPSQFVSRTGVWSGLKVVN